MNPLPSTPEEVKAELQTLVTHDQTATALIRLFEIEMKCGNPLPEAYRIVLRRYLRFTERSNTAAAYRDREWAHALKQAVEEQFPEWGDFHEWPTTPDVDYMCDWLRRLVEDDRQKTER